MLNLAVISNVVGNTIQVLTKKIAFDRSLHFLENFATSTHMLKFCSIFQEINLSSLLAQSICGLCST